MMSPSARRPHGRWASSFAATGEGGGAPVGRESTSADGGAPTRVDVGQCGAMPDNHLSGNPEPRREDVAVTRQLVEAGKEMGIPVHDHLILTDHWEDEQPSYTNLAERGLL